MDKLTPPQIVEQQKLNRLINSPRGDIASFKLLLSMSQFELSQTLNIQDQDNELVPGIQGSLPQTFYRHPKLAYSKQDYLIQKAYKQSESNQDIANIRLLCCLHPQGLSEENNALKIEDEVIQNGPLHVMQLYQDKSTQMPEQDIHSQPTMLYDVLQNLDTINL